MNIAVDQQNTIAQQAGEGLWDRRTRLLARGAAHAALVLPAVTAADVAIHGDPASLVATVHCQVRSQAELPLVARQVEETILPDLENLLAVPFAERKVSFTVAAEQPASRGARPPMSVVRPPIMDVPAVLDPAAELSAAS